MNINLNIERIVLTGDEFGSVSPDSLRAAVAAELTAQLIRRMPDLNHSLHIRGSRGPDVNMTTPSDLAGGIANSVTATIAD